MTVGTRLQLRRNTAANWATDNPVLLAGEAGFETDTGGFKVGDGATVWNLLSYANKTQISALSAPIRTFDVKSYGAKGDGTTDDTTAIQAAAAALVAAQKGVLYFPAGHYKVTASNLVTLNFPGQSVVGDGNSATFIEPTSAVTGDVIRWQMNPWTTTPAGRIANLTIIGTNAGAGACGLHVGDVMGHRLDNVIVSAFDKTGSVGIHFDNHTHWTEESVWTNVYLQFNKVGVQFNVTGGTTSWGYNKINARLDAFGGQTGVVFKNAGLLYNSTLTLTGNLADAACIGVDMQDTTQVIGTLHIALEGNGVQAKGLNIAAGAYLKGVGFIDLAQGGTTLTNTNAGTISFSGWLNAPNIATGEGFRATSNTQPVFTNGVNIGYTGAIMSSGNGVPNWVSTTGNFFFREDDPGTSLHRIYVCTNGGAGTWVGIA